MILKVIYESLYLCVYSALYKYFVEEGNLQVNSDGVKKITLVVKFIR